MRPKLQVFPLVHVSPQVLTFLFVYAYAYTLKACVGLFLSVTKTFFARNLRYLNWYIAIQSAITFSSEVLDNFIQSMISLPKHCCEPAKILARNWFQQKNYLVYVRKYSPMFTYHFQVRRSKRRAAEDLHRQDSPAVAVTGDRPKRSWKLTPRGQAFVERVREMSHQHGDESAGPSHSRQDMVTQLSAGGHVNQQPAQLSAGGFSSNHHQPDQLFAGGPHQNP